jgi:LCP family protein required for cell wall assembly
MVPWLLAAALVAGVAFSMGIRDFATSFSDTARLQYLLVGIGVDLLWRLLSVLDAWWVARAPAGVRDGALRRTGSIIGLVAILGVLLGTHATVARPVYRAYDDLRCITSEVECEDQLDATPDPGESVEPLPSLPTLPAGSIDPGSTPTATPEPTDPPEGLGGRRLNILLVGTNGRLTDTMIVVSIDRQTRQVAFIGMPRDTIGLRIPRDWAAYRAFDGVWPYRANQIFDIAARNPSYFPGRNDRARGYGALKGILGESLGLDIRYYVQVNMDGFMGAVEALGGAMIDVQLPLYDPRYNSADGRGTLKLYMAPGFHFMRGGDALAYARSRHGSSDHERSNRQTRVIAAIRSQLNLASILEPGGIDRYLDLIRDNVRTDIPSKLFPDLADLAQGIDLDRRISLQLAPFTRRCDDRPSAVCDYVSYNRPYGLEANVDRMRRAARDVFADPARIEREQELAAEGAVVEVVNGTSASNQRTTRIADTLACEGIDASVPPVNGGRADRDDYGESVITVYNGAGPSMPETIAAIEKLLRVTAVEADDPARTASIVVIVGKGAPNPRPSCTA